MFASAGAARSSLRLIHPLYGVEPLAGNGRSGDLIRRLAALEGTSVSPGVERPAREAVPLRAADWEAGWNAKDLDAVIRCYSPRSPLARAYARGGRDRERLRSALAAFPDKVSLRIGRLSVSEGRRAVASATLVQRRG